MPKLKKATKAALPYAILALPLVLMDLFIRILTGYVNYFHWRMLLPSILFSVLWIGLIVAVTANLRHTIGRIVYAVLFSLFFIFFFANAVYFPYTDFFFSVKLLALAGEGSAYIWSTILSTNPLTYLSCLWVLASAVFAFLKFPKKAQWDPKPILLAVVIFLLAHSITPFFYGKAYDTLQWDAWRNPRNIYNNFNDSNKSMKISGFFEYCIRDIHKTLFIQTPVRTPEESEILDDVHTDSSIHQANEHTGLLAGKNVIFLQLEGMDSWLITPEDTPNLYKLMGESLSFSQHYSYYTGGGSTFNSELAVNTGFITPITYFQNPYAFTANLYPYSLPKIFKEQGYRVNAFHMNTGEYYSRKLNYLNWGYDNYYGLLDLEKYKDASFELDRELILNPDFYEAMFQGSGPFLHYIITYTPHTPFTVTEGKGLLLAQEKYGASIPKLTEEECARLYAGETDRMVGLMLEALEENGLLENTVIVAFADHYLYTLSDKTILEQYKEVDNNLINQTPFFIWSKTLPAREVTKVNSQIDILPTVLNLFGVKYHDEHYIGQDILADSHPGYVFFSDYSWFDGTFYVENGEVAGEEQPDTEYIIETSTRISQLILKNDLIQKYDYFRELAEQETPTS